MPIIENVYSNEFLELYRNSPERVVFFVGSGLSRPIFPDWKLLLARFVEFTSSAGKLSYPKDELLRYVNEDKHYLSIAETCVTALGKAGYRSFIEKEFDREINVEDLPASYKELFALEPIAVITTNYDRIPDIASAGKYRVITNRTAAEGLRAFEQSKRLIFKIHGDVSVQDSLVLTNQEFNSVYFDNEATQNFIKAVFSTRTVLFLGFSLSDPHLDLILQNLRVSNRGQPIVHYALLSETSQFVLNSIETKYAIRPISYTSSDSSHTEVGEFLRGLRSGATNAPKPTPLANITLSDLSERLNKTGYSQVCIFINKEINILELFVVSLGATHIEHQKEILTIFQLCAIESDEISSVIIHLRRQAKDAVKTTEFDPIFLSARVEFSVLRTFSHGGCSPREFWTTISFSVPFKTGTFDSSKKDIDIPFVEFNQ